MSTKGLLAISLLMAVYASSPFEAQHCDSRGGCYCDCGWATADTCHVDDGSCCFACCCGGGPGPDPPTPPPGPQETYCPSASDLTVAYGVANLYDQGWSITGGGAAATKAAFNLLGGSVEFDIDITGAKTGVNQNIYTISPHGVGSGGFNQNNYCDGAKPAGDQWCVEVDWIESNGNCGGQTTLHDIPGPGSNGCTAWGCASSYHYNGRTSFHMKITYDTNGVWNTYRDGQHIAPSSLNPTPSGSDWANLVKDYSGKGAVVYSSQWVGWVPVDDCGNTGNLDSSHFSIKNLRITGSVLQGPKPRLCSGFLE
jgi:hypothetical protein